MDKFIDRIFKTGIALQGEIPFYMIKNYFSKGLGWADFKQDLKELLNERHPGEDHSLYINALTESFQTDMKNSVNGTYQKEQFKINLIASKIKEFRYAGDVIEVEFSDHVIEVRKKDLYGLVLNADTLAEIIHKCNTK